MYLSFPSFLVEEFLGVFDEREAWLETRMGMKREINSLRSRIQYTKLYCIAIRDLLTLSIT